MKTLFLVAALAVTGCSSPYGRQRCTKSSDCGSPQTCDLCNTGRDAGAGTTVSGLCVLTCVAASECSGLGLKKPACAQNTCGNSLCIDNPF